MEYNSLDLFGSYRKYGWGYLLPAFLASPFERISVFSKMLNTEMTIGAQIAYIYKHERIWGFFKGFPLLSLQILPYFVLSRSDFFSNYAHLVYSEREEGLLHPHRLFFISLIPLVLINHPLMYLRARLYTSLPAPDSPLSLSPGGSSRVAFFRSPLCLLLGYSVLTYGLSSLVLSSFYSSFEYLSSLTTRREGLTQKDNTLTVMAMPTIAFNLIAYPLVVKAWRAMGTRGWGGNGPPGTRGPYAGVAAMIAAAAACVAGEELLERTGDNRREGSR